MSLHVWPASLDSKTCPSPAPGPSENFREKPLTPRNRSSPLFGLIAAPCRKRFGKSAPNDTGLNVHAPPANVPMTAPRANGALVLLEHGPHHVASARLPESATAVKVWPADGSV